MRAPVDRLDALDLLAEAEDDAVCAQREYWSASPISASRKLSIAVALVDDGDLRADGGEHRGVLDADHAGADDDHRVRHARSSLSRPSESRIVRSSNSTRRGRLGRLPAAITIRRHPRPARRGRSITTVSGSSKLAVALERSLVAANWSRMTSVSRCLTPAARVRRSWIVMSSLTRWVWP